MRGPTFDRIVVSSALIRGEQELPTPTQWQWWKSGGGSRDPTRFLREFMCFFFDLNLLWIRVSLGCEVYTHLSWEPEVLLIHLPKPDRLLITAAWTTGNNLIQIHSHPLHIASQYLPQHHQSNKRSGFLIISQILLTNSNLHSDGCRTSHRTRKINRGSTTLQIFHLLPFCHSETGVLLGIPTGYATH